MTRDERDWRCWLAGFLDGDGSICIIRGEKQYSPRVTVYQSEPYHQIIFEIQRRYGGSVNPHGYKKDYGQMWGCAWSHRKAEKMVAYLLPFLKVKQEQAKAFLAYCKHKAKPYGYTAEFLAVREELANSVNKFNHRNSTPSEAEVEHLRMLNYPGTCDGHTPAAPSEGLRDDLLLQVTVS